MLCDCEVRVHPGIDCSSEKCHCHIRPRTHNVFENNEVVELPEVVEEEMDELEKKLVEEEGFTTTAEAVLKNKKKAKKDG